MQLFVLIRLFDFSCSDGFECGRHLLVSFLISDHVSSLHSHGPHIVTCLSKSLASFKLVYELSVELLVLYSTFSFS